ncbi:MAG: hypothetical protein QW331_00795 [Candidatus Woesearchaeota archaeon]
MLFWRKDKTREIRENLATIRRRVAELKSYEQKKEAAHKIIQRTKSAIEEGKKEIFERATEEKRKPWIDPIFDPKIDSLALQEVEALMKLEKDLNDYEELILATKDDYELNDVVIALEQELFQIIKREQNNEAILREMEIETEEARLRKASATPPSLRTKDGTSWKNISEVVRRLGGWVEYSGTPGSHNFKIRFPNSERPIPFSEDVYIEGLTRQIIAQLRNFLPQHKIPNNNLLRKALKNGDIRLAV